MTIPVLELGPDPMERGRAQGRALRADIQKNVDIYVRRFGRLGYGQDSVLAEAAKWLPHLDRLDPVFTAEMRGVAEGSGCSLGEITMLNVRYELLIMMYKLGLQGAGVPRPADGCTSFAALPERTAGETFLGQTWDWLPGVEIAAMRVKRDDAPDFVCVGEAGTVGGLQGVNEHGIGVVINALMSTDDGTYEYQKPFRMRVRDVLNAKNMHAAFQAIADCNRVVSMNFIVGHSDGEAFDIEAGPDRCAFIHPEDGLITHSNDFCALDIKSDIVRIWPNTIYRKSRLRKLLAQTPQLDVPAIKRALSDHFSHPHSICAHLDESEPEAVRVQTISSVVIGLQERAMYVTDGPACENEYQRIALRP